jgi:hypothetical protein
MLFFLFCVKSATLRKPPKKVVSKNAIKKRDTSFERKLILLFFELAFFLCSSFS